MPGATVFVDSNGNGLRDPGEQTAVTDTSGKYTLNNVQSGNYTVRLETTASPLVQAISAPAGTQGTEPAQPYTFGDGFSANATIEITSLGVFADGAVGSLRQPLTAVLYDATTHIPVTSMEFTPQDSGTAMGGYFYKPLPTPVHVYAGFHGIIAAYGFGPNQKAGDPHSIQPNVPWTANTNNGLVTYTVQSYASAPNTYPGTVDTAVGSTPYAAGSFLFQAPSLVLTTPKTGTYSVTIDTSGFDLSEHNDFGILALAAVSGTINTQTKPNTPPAPAQGVVVDLYSNGVVVGSAKTDASGNYSIGGLDPGSYTAHQEIPTGLRQATPANSNLSLATPPTGSDVFTLPSGYGTLASVVGDFNADGKADLAVVGEPLTNQPGPSEPNVFIYYGGATTTPIALTGPIVGTANNQPVQIVAGFTNGSTMSLTVLFLLGQVVRFDQVGGSFQPGVLIASLPNPGGSFEYKDMVIGNFNGSQTSSIVVEYSISGSPGYGLIEVGPGNQPITLAASSVGEGLGNLVASDVNGDGYTDLIVAPGTISPVVYYNVSAGTFRAVSISTFPETLNLTYLMAADINGDGRIDIGETVNDGTFRFALQNSSEDFPTSSTVPLTGSAYYQGQTLLVDLNGDGRPDLVTLFANDVTNQLAFNVALNTGVGPSWFQPLAQQKSYPLSTGGFHAGQGHTVAADLENDGLLDLVEISTFLPLVQIVHNRTSLASTDIPVTLIAGEALTNQNFVDLLPATAAVDLAISPTLGSGDYTVSYKAGNIEVSDSVLGRVLVKPLTEMNSLTITAPDGQPGSLTIDESGVTFSLPGGISFAGSALTANTVRLISGPGNDSIGISDQGATLNGRAIVSWSNLDQMVVSSGGGDDVITVSGEPHARGLITLDGGQGANTYAIASQGANIAVVDTANRGTLDFSGASSGVTIDLRMAQGQSQFIGAGGNMLALYGLIANLTGSPYDDVLRGNDLDNIIRGLGGNDVIFGYGGNDLLDGGDGNDTIIAGTRNSILLGGAGEDLMVAGPGRNLLIGGAGRDILIGDHPGRGRGRSQGGSILVAGATKYDANDAALHAIMSEWASQRSRFVRARNLLDGRGSRHRLNGSVFLNAKAIRSDHTVNTLVGHNRYNWFRLDRGSRRHAPARGGPERCRETPATGRVFGTRGASLALSGLTIADGRADNGAGILNQSGRLALTRVVLRGNRARYLGSGLYNDGIATLTGATSTANAAGLGGGIVNLGRLSVSEVTVRRNVALSAGDLFNRAKLRRIPRRAPAGPRLVGSVSL